MGVATPAGIGADYLTPGTLIEINFAQGPATAGVGARDVVLAMPKLASGSWTAGTLYEINGESDAIAGAAAGSPLHRAARAFLAINKTTRLWALPVAPTTGGSPVAASNTITVGGPATAAGVATITICGEECSVSYASGATATAVGTALTAAINAKTWLPVTASGTTSIVITAKLTGASSNGLTVRSSVTASSGITLSGAAALASGAEGSTTEAAQLTTALASIAGTRRYYIGSSGLATEHSAALQTHIAAKSLANPGLHSVGVVASRDTYANTVTIANARNYERIRMVWQQTSDHDAAELVGYALAVFSFKENNDPAFNFDGFRGDSQITWPVRPQFSTSDWPTATTINGALQNGITPIQSVTGGSYIVSSVTTRSKTSGGSVNDWRVLDSHRVSVADYVADLIRNTYALRYSASKFKSDQLLADGSVDPNQPVIRGVATPEQIKRMIFEILDQVDDDALIQDLAATKASVQVQRSVTNAGRAACQLNLRTIDLLHQGTFVINEVSPA